MQLLTKHLINRLNVLLIVTLLVSLLPPVPLTLAATVGHNQADGPQPLSSHIDAVSTANRAIDPGLMFIENVGQLDAAARFVVRGNKGTLYLAPDALRFTIAQHSPAEISDGLDKEFDRVAQAHRQRLNENNQTVNLKLSFPGANPAARIEPFNRLKTGINSFIGNNPTQWYTNIPTWGGVRYVDLYPGLDLEITGLDGHWDWRLVSHRALSDLRQLDIRLQLEGADSLAVEEDQLRLTTAIGDYSLPLLPVVNSDGTLTNASDIQPVINGSEVAFPFASSSTAPALIPLADTSADLLYGSFLGGNDDEDSHAIAVEDNGGDPYVYIVGKTKSTDFPTENPLPNGSTNAGNADVFVAKLNPNATGANQLVYATFLGGSWSDSGLGLAVDETGAAYLTGGTSSIDFPTQNPYQPYLAFDGVHPYYDAFVTKLSATGDNLVFSTYLGGLENDEGWDIAIDDAGSAYVTGYTLSDTFPVESPVSGYETRNGSFDIFVTKFSPAGTVLEYSTFLGGSGFDRGNGLAIDETGAAYITGEYTDSGSDVDTFATKLIWDDSTGSLSMDYNRFLGGSSGDYGYDIAVDNDGNAYLTGETLSLYGSRFPQVNPLENTGTVSVVAAFVAKLDRDYGSTIYSTFLNGNGRGIAVDSNQNAYVTGQAGSGFPIVNGSLFAGGYYDAFIAKLVWDETTLELDYSTLLGGSGEDIGYGVALAEQTGAVDVYVTGSTVSTDFANLTANAYDSTLNPSGATDAFVVGLALTNSPPSPPDPITTSGFKGANWLSLNPTDVDDYGLNNIGWNLELSPHIINEAVVPTGAQINDLYDQDVQTIVRLNVGPPIQNPGADFVANTTCDDFNNWMIGTVDDHYTKVMTATGKTSGAVPIFILDNEPNLDWPGYNASQYAHVFNCYYQHWREQKRPQWLFVAGPGDQGGAFVQFYQELLNTGEETIADADGFAIHAYGYCQDCNVEDTPNVDDPDYAIREGVWESRFSDAWIDGWNVAIADRTDLQNKPVIITEYNPGRKKDEQDAEVIYVNTIQRDAETMAELWPDWFDKTTCWASEINTLRGLLYFVDEGAPGRNAPTADDWLEGSLQSNPAARAAWLAASPTPDCNAVLGAEVGGESLPTVGSIGGVISGTLGIKGFNNVFYVMDNLEVPVDQTLTLALGTTLVFSPGLQMDVAGQLIAEGNTVFPVRFISTDDAGWAGLNFQPSSQGSRCLGCSLENLEAGTTALTVQAPVTFQYGEIRDVPGGTAISSTVPFTLTNLVIDYVDTGLHLAGSNAVSSTISHLTLGRCRQGIVNQGQHLTVENSILTTCDVAVSTELTGTTFINYTMLHNNGQDFVTAPDSQLNQGAGLLAADPLFIDFPDNYQLQSDSPAVNAADPLSDYSRELGYNGGRADLGAYGNTWQARQRPPLAQMAVSLDATTSQKVGQPGETITYTLTLKNSGSVPDSYTVSIEGARYKSRLFENGYAGPRQIHLAPQEEISVTVWVDIPPLTTLGVTGTTPVWAFNGYGIEAEVDLTTSVTAYQETGGQVVLEAEHFSGQIERSSRSWLTQTVLAGYVGDSYLNAVPDTDLQFTTAYTAIAPELQYAVNVTHTGVYTVWLRGYAPNGAGDSIYVGLDNQPATVLSGFTPRTWSWTAQRTGTPSGAVTLTVTEPGIHVLRLWQREDGLRLDRIVLTTDGNYNPSGSGPPESEFE